MKIDQTALQRIAYLAKLDLDKQDEEDMRAELNTLLTWVEKINELTTDGVYPLETMSVEQNVWREDVPEILLSHEAGLKNAPACDTDYFRVPPVQELLY